VSFAAITLYVASQRAVPKVSIYFAIDSVRKLLDTSLYIQYSETINGEFSTRVIVQTERGPVIISTLAN